MSEENQPVELENEGVEQESSQEEEVGKIVNFYVGINGSNIYRVSSNEPELNLRDHIEALSTIEINTISALLEDKEKALEAVSLFLAMKEELMSQAINLIVDNSEVENKEEIKALFASSQD